MVERYCNVATIGEFFWHRRQPGLMESNVE